MCDLKQTQYIFFYLSHIYTIWFADDYIVLFAKLLKKEVKTVSNSALSNLVTGNHSFSNTAQIMLHLQTVNSKYGMNMVTS